MPVRTGLALVFCFAMSEQLRAQGTADAPARPSAATDQVENGDDFGQLFSEWTEAIQGIQSIQARAKDASDAKKQALQDEFRQSILSVRSLSPRLIVAAEKAYREQPNENPKAAQFLMSVLVDYIRRDNFEEALRLSQVLIDGDPKDKRVYLVAGVSAAATSEYDLAEQYLKSASDAGLFESGTNPEDRLGETLARQATQILADLPRNRGLWDTERKIRAAETAADDLPRVEFQTAKGNVVLELFENEAPNTVANFISLVEEGFYDGLSFHRVLPGFMVQGGCPKGDGTGGPGYHIPCEVDQEDHRSHFRGSLSMAHAGPNTGGSQFFLTFVRTPHLDGKHTVFGRVVDGMAVLSRLTRIDPSQTERRGPPADEILKATVVRKRDHDYQPKKLPAQS